MPGDQAIVKANGGRVLGEVSHPYGTTDFSSYLVAAQASGAKIIALANASTDTVTAVKQAGEFGIGKSGQKLAGLLVSIADVHAIGLADAAGFAADRKFLLGPKRHNALSPRDSRRRCRAASLRWSKPVRIRADGRVIRDDYLFQIKTPAESKGPWDYYKLVRTIPAAEAARPESEGGCKLADH